MSKGQQATAVAMMYPEPAKGSGSLESEELGISGARLYRAGIDDRWCAPQLAHDAHWQVEGKQRILGHGGCGAGLIREATRRSNDLLRESASSRHSRRKIIIVVIIWVRNLMFQVIAATIILLTTAIGWVAIALAAREAWKQHKQARRPS